MGFGFEAAMNVSCRNGGSHHYIFYAYQAIVANPNYHGHLLKRVAGYPCVNPSKAQAYVIDLGHRKLTSAVCFQC